jgi:vesicle-associated membrane protein 7
MLCNCETHTHTHVSTLLFRSLLLCFAPSRLSFSFTTTGLAVITGLSYPSRVAIQMLQETYGEVMNKFSSEVMAGGENALTKKCKSLLQTACQKYDDLSQVDKASSLLGKVDGVKSQMQTNISDMLKNTDKADSLAEKSDQLNEQASVFKKKSTDLRKQMAWKNLKMTLLLGGIVVIILVVVLAPLIKKRSKKN